MSETILLCPRPLARSAGRFLLLPLLPHKPPLRALPAEVWTQILYFVLSDSLAGTPPVSSVRTCLSLMSVCQSFKEMAMPFMYSHVVIRSVGCFDKFTACLYAADQKWDSIRRIPYSTPGRWVQTLDLSGLGNLDSRQLYTADLLLTKLFPLLPFLARLSLSPALPLSRRALASLANKDGNSALRAFCGIRYDASWSSTAATGDDPFVQLLLRCHNLERLEIVGYGMEGSLDPDTFPDDGSQVPASTVKLHLPRLHILTLTSMPSSSLLHALLDTSLPCLRALSITPYEDIPYPASCTTRFLQAHGRSLFALSFYTHKSWPTHLHPSPATLLETCPNLRHLSLEFPLPDLVVPASPPAPLPLQILSIPRPDRRFWRVLEPSLPSLPALKMVRIRDVRWINREMSSRAQETGVQGEMRDWRRRLARKGIRVLDGDWQDMP